MPIIQSAKKRVKTTARQTEENRLHRSRSRTALKNVRDLLAAGKVDEAAGQVATAQKYLDKAAKVRAFHPNTVARYKANLSAALKKAGYKGATPKKVAAKPKAKTVAPKTPGTKPAAKKTPAKPAAKTDGPK